MKLRSQAIQAESLEQLQGELDALLETLKPEQVVAVSHAQMPARWRGHGWLVRTVQQAAFSVVVVYREQ